MRNMKLLSILVFKVYMKYLVLIKKICTNRSIEVFMGSFF